MSKTTKELAALVASSAAEYGETMAFKTAELAEMAKSRTALALQIKALAEQAVAQELEVLSLRATVSSQADNIAQLQAALANTGNPSTGPGTPVVIPPFPGGQKGDFWEVVS